jgi:HPt (histidine-containing phosphotransfer) domain-containing protein
MFTTLATHLQGLGSEPELGAPGFVPEGVSHAMALDAPQSEAETLALWDRLALQAYVGNHPGQQHKLLAAYLASAVESVQAARQAIQARDWTAAAAQGHRLKSSSRCVGAMQLASLCESLERAGNSGNAEACAALEAPVQQAFATLQTRMEAELEA